MKSNKIYYTRADVYPNPAPADNDGNKEPWFVRHDTDTGEMAIQYISGEVEPIEDIFKHLYEDAIKHNRFIEIEFLGRKE
jgi:hypothetical protein